MVEIEIIEECRRGDLRNFRTVVEKVSPYAYSLAFRMLGDEASARDIAQESLVTLWKKISTVRTPEALKSWIYRTVLNKCYDELRRRKNEIMVTWNESDWNRLSETVSGSSASSLETDECSGILEMLTSGLSPVQKSVFVLAELEGLDHSEISDLTGMSRSAVKANLWHARTRMKELVKKYM